MAFTVFAPGGGYADALGGHQVWTPDALGGHGFALGSGGLFNPHLPDGTVFGTGPDAGQPYGPADIALSAAGNALGGFLSHGSGLSNAVTNFWGGGGMGGSGEDAFATTLSNALVNGVLAHTGLERNPGGRIGAMLGSTFLTPALGPVGPVAGAALGSLFGPGPSVGPGATTGIDFTTGQPWGQSGDNGGLGTNLDPFLQNQVADLSAALGSYGGSLDLSRLQYGNQPGNRGPEGPLNQFAAYDNAGNPHVLAFGGYRDSGVPNNPYDVDPHELIRQLVDAGLYQPADAAGLQAALGPRKLVFSPEQLAQVNAQAVNDRATWDALLQGGGGA